MRLGLLVFGQGKSFVYMRLGKRSIGGTLALGVANIQKDEMMNDQINGLVSRDLVKLGAFTQASCADEMGRGQ